jgi:iron complex outermembrane receptor protein
MRQYAASAIFFSLVFCVLCPRAHALDSPELARIVVIKHEDFGHTFSQDAGSLTQRSSSSVVGLLDYLPLDIQSRSFPQDIQSDFSLRGTNISGVLMLVDGIRVNDPQTAHHNSDIPLTLEDIQAVQVLPGAASSLFGPDAIGGAINIVLKKPTQNRMVLETHGGSFHSAGGYLSVSRAGQEAAIRMTLARDVSSGFRFDTDTKRTTADALASIKLPAGTFDTFFGYNQKEFGAFDFYTPGLGYASREKTKTLLFETGCELDSGGLLVKPQLVWRRHYDTFILDETRLRSNSINRHRTDMYTPSVYLRRSLARFGTVGAGVEYGGEHIVSTNLGTHTRNHTSVFVDESWGEFFSLIPSWSFRFDNFDSFGGMATGSVALKKSVADCGTLSLGVVRTGRVPSFTELFYSDPTTAGDPALAPEEALAIQLGAGYRQAPWDLGATVFFRKEKNMIDWVKHTASQSRWIAENINRADIRGVEAYGRLAINTVMSLESNYAFVDKNVHEQGLLYKYGQNYARHLAHLVAAFHLPFGTQTCGLAYKKKPGRGGWLLLEVGLTHRLGRGAEIFCSFDNALDKEYEEIPGVDQAGRSIQAGLRFEW